jgi:hypothetical protein
MDLMFAVVIIGLTLWFGRSIGVLALPMLAAGAFSWIAKEGTLVDGQSRRMLARSALPGLAVLCASLAWARIATSIFQAREGFVEIGSSARGAYYEYWGWIVPAVTSGILFVGYVLGASSFFARRGRLDLLIAFLGCVTMLLTVCAVFYALLLFEAFN